MRRSLSHLAVTLALLASLAACKQTQTPNAVAGASAPVKIAAETPPVPDGPVYLVPAKLAACEPGAVVVVHWDMRKTRPDIANVEIWTGAPGTQTLFAAGGYAGEASTTQPWARPGTTFSVRNKADGKEVATAVVEGPSCNK